MKKKRRKSKNTHPAPRKGGNSIEEAVRLHRSGKLTKAEKAYRRVLRTSPRDPQALYLCGVVTAQLGNPGGAIELFQDAVSHRPDHLQSLNELAKLYQETGQLEASADALRQLIALRPDLGDLQSNLALVLKRLGKPEAAASACEKAINSNPDCAEAYSILGDIFKESRRFDEAIGAYRRTIELKPEQTGVYRNLLAVCRSSGRHEEAVDTLRQWLERDPGNPIAQHMMAASSDDAPPSRASDEYIRKVFDEFAATFDQALHGLDYQGPQLMGDALKEEWPEGIGGLSVLDAGCGTGLCGPFLRPIAGRLVGVDLSAMMLQRAQESDHYDELVEAEVTGYLEHHPRSFDLIVAADTFNYFGALESLLLAASRALKASGVLIYTLEYDDGVAAAGGYQLNLHGRYSHDQHYVVRCMTACGLTVRSMEVATLRKERDQPVPVTVVRARKDASQTG